MQLTMVALLHVQPLTQLTNATPMCLWEERKVMLTEVPESWPPRPPMSISVYVTECVQRRREGCGVWELSSSQSVKKTQTLPIADHDA